MVGNKRLFSVNKFVSNADKAQPSLQTLTVIDKLMASMSCTKPVITQHIR